VAGEYVALDSGFDSADRLVSAFRLLAVTYVCPPPRTHMQIQTHSERYRDTSACLDAQRVWDAYRSSSSGRHALDELADMRASLSLRLQETVTRYHHLGLRSTPAPGDRPAPLTERTAAPAPALVQHT
jgi:hypothetical protein